MVTGVLTARSRCTTACAAWTTAADTAELKPAGDVGRGPSRSCKKILKCKQTAESKMGVSLAADADPEI